MKAQVLTGSEQMELMEMPAPVIENDTDVLLKINYVGICGSDVHYYKTGKIGSNVVTYPYIVGHECSATVIEIGKKVTRVKVGDEVVVDPAVSCYTCEQCKVGRLNTCKNLSFLGTPGEGDGCLCEYIVISQASCYSTDGKISLEEGVLCEPFAIGVYAVKGAQMPEGATIAILGSGPIGLCCMAAAGAQGVSSIYMTDKIAGRVAIAKRSGAAWVGNPDDENIVDAILEKEPLGVDVVYECAGQQETLDEAVELLKPGGKLMLIGIPQEQRVSFMIDKIRRKEITIVNVRRQNECTQAAIDLFGSGKVDLDFLITHKFDLERFKEAFELVEGYKDGVIKALIKI